MWALSNKRRRSLGHYVHATAIAIGWIRIHVVYEVRVTMLKVTFIHITSDLIRLGFLFAIPYQRRIPRVAGKLEIIYYEQTMELRCNHYNIHQSS